MLGTVKVDLVKSVTDPGRFFADDSAQRENGAFILYVDVLVFVRSHLHRDGIAVSSVAKKEGEHSVVCNALEIHSKHNLAKC